MNLNINRRIKNGMWVRVKLDSTGESTGILQNLDMMRGTCDVHLVADDGTTRMVLPGMQLTAVSQARRAHIPESRRPDDITAKRLGY